MDTSHISMYSDGEDYEKMVIIGPNLRNSGDIQQAIEKLNKEVFFTDTVDKFIEDYNTLFVFEHFDGEQFQHLRRLKKRIISSALLLHETNIQQDEVVIPYHMRPLYCKSMVGMVIAFDDTRSKSRNIKQLSRQAQFMGAILKEELLQGVTHLVAESSNSDEYRLALNFEIKIVTWDWISYCWESRNDLEFKADAQNVIELFQWKPFRTLTLLFYGFNEEEEQKMVSIVETNQGSATSFVLACTHVIVNEMKTKSLDLPDLPRGIFTVTSKWFWHSICMMARAQESLYSFVGENKFKVPQPVTDDALSPSKRIQRTQSQERQSKLRQIVNRAISKTAEEKPQHNVNKRPPATKREHIIQELYNTECNYLKILTAIVKDLKEVAERPEARVGPILTPQESKEIFSGIVPIRDLHQDIKDQLEEYVENWEAERPLGDAYCTRRDQLLRSYQQFINFIDLAKSSIQTYRRRNVRFLGLLNSWEKLEKCGRQSLEDLMMRPVQRLPSVFLLITEVNKLTPPEHRDYNSIQLALKTLEEVLKEINKKKCRSDELRQIFDIAQTIRRVPDTLISASRTYICQVKCFELTNLFKLGKRQLTIFLFSDCIVIVKNKPIKNTEVLYKFVVLLDFFKIKKLINVLDNKGQLDSMGIIVDDDDRLDLHAFHFKDILEENKDFMDRFASHICDFYGCFQNVMVVSLTHEELQMKPAEKRRLTNQFSALINRTGSFRMPTLPSIRKAMSVSSSSQYGSSISINSMNSTASSSQWNSINQDDTLNQTIIHTPDRLRDTRSERVNNFLDSFTTPRQGDKEGVLKYFRKRLSTASTQNKNKY